MLSDAKEATSSSVCIDWDGADLYIFFQEQVPTLSGLKKPQQLNNKIDAVLFW